MRRTRVTPAAVIITPVATRILIGKKHRAGGRKGGRPSRANALLLSERILEVATELFLVHGYGSTTIESVATRAGISKRTFYDRFVDKAVLFTAVVHRIIEQIRPRPDVPLIVGADLREVLQRIAGLILRAALSPQAIALHRLATAESARFPKLAYAVENNAGKEEATQLIEGLLAQRMPHAKASADDRRFAAEQFIYMILTVPQRRALGFGAPMSAAELDSWAEQTVALFLQGYAGFPT
jgi:TetR/AcrR family transcriptional regulator, mexJK operon transcriptional repressor